MSEKELKKMRSIDTELSYDESALQKMVEKLTMMAEDFDDPEESDEQEQVAKKPAIQKQKTQKKAPSTGGK